MLSAAHICSRRSWERWLSVYILIGRHMPCNVCYSGGIQTTKHRDSASHSKEMSWLPSRMFVIRQMCLWKTFNSYWFHAWLFKHFIRMINQISGFWKTCYLAAYHSYTFLIDYPLGCFWYRQWPYLYVSHWQGGIWAVKFLKCLDKCYLKVIILSIKTRTCFMIRKPHVFVISHAFTISCFISPLWSISTFLVLSCTNSINM